LYILIFMFFDSRQEDKRFCTLLSSQFPHESNFDLYL
jgi:hypothetical protein